MSNYFYVEPVDVNVNLINTAPDPFPLKKFVPDFSELTILPTEKQIQWPNTSFIIGSSLYLQYFTNPSGLYKREDIFGNVDSPTTVVDNGIWVIPAYDWKRYVPLENKIQPSKLEFITHSRAADSMILSKFSLSNTGLTNVSQETVTYSVESQPTFFSEDITLVRATTVPYGNTSDQTELYYKTLTGAGHKSLPTDLILAKKISPSKVLLLCSGHVVISDFVNPDFVVTRSGNVANTLLGVSDIAFDDEGTIYLLKNDGVYITDESLQSANKLHNFASTTFSLFAKHDNYIFTIDTNANEFLWFNKSKLTGKTTLPVQWSNEISQRSFRLQNIFMKDGELYLHGNVRNGGNITVHAYGKIGKFEY